MKILIIKLGAMGDVLRTTPLLSALKKKYPGAHITWLVEKACLPVLEGSPLIDRLVFYSFKNSLKLSEESFDWAINLDKEREALGAMTLVRAAKKQGFGEDAGGRILPLDTLSDYAYRLGVDDDLKFRKNKKTYQQIIFEQVGFRYSGQEYVFSVNKGDEVFADTFMRGKIKNYKKNRRPIIGLNTGSGKRFAGKQLATAVVLELIEKLGSEMNAIILLLGGRDEINRNKKIEKLSRYPVINTGAHSIRRFASLVRRCDAVVSADTTAMHIAIAVKTSVVAYFASTCAAEIDLYGRGEKVVSTISCAPCYKKVCPIDEQCMKEMSADDLLAAVRRQLQ